MKSTTPSGNHESSSNGEKSQNVQGKNRYSDEELKEFEDLIVRKLEKEKEKLSLLKLNYSKTENNDNDTSSVIITAELAIENGFKEEHDREISRQDKFITLLENALLRVKNKTYGVCRITGELIPKERLCLVLHATTCVDAKNSENERKEEEKKKEKENDIRKKHELFCKV